MKPITVFVPLQSMLLWILWDFSLKWLDVRVQGQSVSPDDDSDDTESTAATGKRS